MPVVNTNIAALNAQRALTINERALSQAVNQLSTGKRINSAGDDAAGLAIVNKMATQVRGLNQAVRNANDGISMIQTADGASSTLTDILFRMRELSVQAANGTYSTNDRSAINSEFTSLKSEMTRIITSTTWNNMHILGASGTSVSLQIGQLSTDQISVSFTNFNTLSAVSNAINLSAANATQALTKIDNAITAIDSKRSSWGASINRLVYAADNATQVATNLEASRSRIQDTDYAKATAELARAQIIQQAGNAMLSQANQQPAYVLALLR